MRFRVNAWRLSDGDFSFAKYGYYQRIYFRHLLRVGLPRKSAALKYFATPFFHDSRLTKVDLRSWNGQLSLEIIREEADSEDINEFRKTIGLPKITQKEFARKPLVYRFDFSGVDRSCLTFDGKYLGGFWIMDCELDKSGSKFKLTISQDIANELSFVFSSCRFHPLVRCTRNRHTFLNFSDFFHDTVY